MYKRQIPASGFYEWDGHKHKFTFENEKRSLLLMTGIYRNVNGQTEVTIVTTKANKSMCEIHDRMPLILEEHLNHDWLENRHIEALLRLSLIHISAPIKTVLLF